MKRALHAVAAAAVLTAATVALDRVGADATDAVIVFLGLVVAIAFWTSPVVAIPAAAVAAFVTDVYFLPPYGVMMPSVDGYLAIAAFVTAAGASSHAAGAARTQRRQRDALIAQLRENEASLERRVQERTEALSRTEERLRLAAKATNDALWDWDLPSGMLWWNDAFGSLFGHQMRAPTAEDWMRLVHADDRERVRRSIRQTLDGHGDAWHAEYRFARANGSYAWVLDRGFVVRGAGGARRMIGAMMDISERKASERMKSDFVSFVSHQLRTPLSGMSWMLELAADSGELTPTANEYVSEARASAARLVTLVNDLLDIARLESGRVVAAPERLDVAALTGSVVREMQTLIDEKRHALVFEAAPAFAWADPQLIRQAVGNLISNGIKYTPPRGRLTIGIREANGIVQWSVADSGMGIPRLAQARLFERFYRADNAVAMEVEGTGLGLHLVRLIVEQAGGRVWCESEEGRGSVFSFTLPAAVEEVRAS